MLISCICSPSESMVSHLFEQCKLLDWIVDLPRNVIPTPLPNASDNEAAAAAAKTPLRAGYLGHVTHISGVIEGLHRSMRSSTDGGSFGGGAGGSGAGPSPSQFAYKIAAYVDGNKRWGQYVSGELAAQQELENTAK